MRIPNAILLLLAGVSLTGPARAAGRPPTITSFTATPAKVTAGQPSTLSWTVTGFPSLIVNPGVGGVSGTSVKVTPSTTTTYALTATNSFGSATAAVTVTVVAGSPPTIASFAATPAKVSPGQSSTLSWAVTGSPRLSVNSGVGAVAGASVRVTPSATTSYTLTATNTFGSVTAAVTVMVGSPPLITGFTATPAKVTLGQSSTLSWAVTSSPGLIVNPGVGAVTGTSVIVTPSTTTTYTLTATNSFGSAGATATATVAPANPPVISTFIANPASVGPGIRTTLLWVTSGAASVTIDHGVGTVTGSSVIVTPTAATTYTLTATNGAGRVTATARVSYIPLVTVSSQLYYTEHAVFIIPPPNQVTWTGPGLQPGSDGVL